jgi:predicted ABC-type ATPase
MDIQKISNEIATLKRAVKSAATVSLKDKLKNKVKSLEQVLKDANIPAKKLAMMLLGAKRKVASYTQAEFNEVIKRLSYKAEYSFLKGLTKVEVKDDLKREAKTPGWRFKGRNNFKTPTKSDLINDMGKPYSKRKTYYESRSNRSDVTRPAKLKDGGEVGVYDIPKNVLKAYDRWNDPKIMPNFLGSEKEILNAFSHKLKADGKIKNITSGGHAYVEALKWLDENKSIMKKGGGLEEEDFDLFEDFDNLPKNIQDIFFEYEDSDDTYERNEEMLSRLKPLGYTFDYGLDATPYGLKKMEKGGGLNYKAQNFLDTIRISDRSIQLKDVTVEGTPKGNWKVYHKGKSLMTVNGNLLNEETITKYELEHHQEMAHGGGVGKIKYSVNFKARDRYNNEALVIESNKTIKQIEKILYNIEYSTTGRYIQGSIIIKDTNGITIRLSEYTTNIDIQKLFDEEYNTKKKKGGVAEAENKEMVLNNAQQIEHHAEELENAASKAKHIPAWVVAKIYNASSNISDATHYLEGVNTMPKEQYERIHAEIENNKMETGGGLNSFLDMQMAVSKICKSNGCTIKDYYLAEKKYSAGGGIGGTFDSSSTGVGIGGTDSSSETGTPIGGTAASSMAKGGAVVGAKFKHDGKEFEVKKVQDGAVYTTNGKVYSLKTLESFGVTFNKERAKSNKPRGIRGERREEMEYQLEDLKNDLRYAKQDLRDVKRDMEEEAGEKGDNWTDADANRYGEQMNFIEEKIESLEKQIAEKEERLSYAKGGGVKEEIAKMGTIVITKEYVDKTQMLSSAYNMSDINYYMFRGELKRPIEEAERDMARAKQEIEVVNKRLPFTTWELKLKKGQNKFEFMGDVYEIYTEKRPMDTYGWKKRNWEKTYYGIRKITNNDEKDYFSSEPYSDKKENLVSGLNWNFIKLIYERGEIDFPLPVKPNYAKGGGVGETCEIFDSNGERAIDNKSIEKLTKCVTALPQTKSSNIDTNGNYTKERQKLHKEIIDKFKKDVVCIKKGKPIAVLMGGSPASGKSTFLKKYRPYLLSDSLFKVDADEIRAELPEYKGWNATQTHEETGNIVDVLISDRNVGIPCKFDFVFDGTMSSTKRYKILINNLRKEGYDIYIVFMGNIPKEEIKERALERYKKSGRFVPMFVIEDFYANGEKNLKELKSMVDGYIVVDGSSYDYKIIEQGGKKLPNKRLYEKLGEKIKLKTGGGVDKKKKTDFRGWKHKNKS